MREEEEILKILNEAGEVGLRSKTIESAYNILNRNSNIDRVSAYNLAFNTLLTNTEEIDERDISRNRTSLPDEEDLEVSPIEEARSDMFKDMNSIVQEANISGAGVRTGWVDAYNATLDEGLGELPESFKYDGEIYTAASFYKMLGINMEDYVSLTSFTNHQMHSKCMLQIPDNWLWEESYNVTVDELFQSTIRALKSGYTVAWGADVSEEGFSFRNGIAIVPDDNAQIKIEGEDNKNFSDAGADKFSEAFLNPVKEVSVTQEMRQKGYDEKETTDDHGMHIIGYSVDNKGRVFFLVKNSWGTSNYPEGYLYVSESYFKLKTINIYLHKEAVSDQLRSKIGLK